KGRFSPRGEDPLAELARLIGQDDPFADFHDAPRANNGDSRTRERQDFDTRRYAREPLHAEADAGDRRDSGVVALRRNRRGPYAYAGPPELRQPRAAEPYYEDDRQLDPNAAGRAPYHDANYARELDPEYDDPRYAREPHGADYQEQDPAYVQEYEEERYAGEY